jgi:hypothetical protein
MKKGIERRMGSGVEKREKKAKKLADGAYFSIG